MMSSRFYGGHMNTVSYLSASQAIIVSILFLRKQSSSRFIIYGSMNNKLSARKLNVQRHIHFTIVSPDQIMAENIL